MCKPRLKLTSHAQNKLKLIHSKLNTGTSFVKLGGRKLHTPVNSGLCVSFILSPGERAILCRKENGSFKVEFSGTHQSYDRKVSRNGKRHLNH